jgi:hypothetical protein
VTRNLPLCVYGHNDCTYYLDGLCEIEDVEDCPVKDDWEADEDYVPCDVVDCIHQADGLCYAPATRTRIGCVRETDDPR